MILDLSCLKVVYSGIIELAGILKTNDRKRSEALGILLQGVSSDFLFWQSKGEDYA